MTAPTPHEELAESVKVDWELDHALVEKALGEFNDLANALAAVTAERDQARESSERYSTALGELREQAVMNETHLRKELDQARQMLADAPHAGSCMTEAAGVYARLQGLPAECDCWKAGL